MPSQGPQLRSAVSSYSLPSCCLGVAPHPPPTPSTPSAPHCLLPEWGRERRNSPFSGTLRICSESNWGGRGTDPQTRKVGRGRWFSGLEKPPSPHRGGGCRKTGAQTPLAQTRPASLKAGKPRSFKTFMPFDPEMLLLRICPKKIIKKLT